MIKKISCGHLICKMLLILGVNRTKEKFLIFQKYSVEESKETGRGLVEGCGELKC